MDANIIINDYFTPAGLFINKREWQLNKDGTFSFSGTIDSLQEGLPTHIVWAVHKPFTTSEASSDEVVKKLFEIAKSEKLWLGSYNEYHSVIEWDSNKNQFIKRTMKDAEKNEKNSLY